MNAGAIDHLKGVKLFLNLIIARIRIFHVQGSRLYPLTADCPGSDGSVIADIGDNFRENVPFDNTG